MLAVVSAYSYDIPRSFVLPDSPIKARFLNHEEKVIAIERLRANNQVRAVIQCADHSLSDFGPGNRNQNMEMGPGILSAHFSHPIANANSGA